MESELQQEIYKAIVRFIGLVNSHDGNLLRSEVGISEPVSSELYEILAEYFNDDIPPLSAPPIEKAFANKINGKVPVDIYELNEPNAWGVDCALWVKGSPVEPILHLQFSKKDEHLYMQYKYIGS